MTIANQRRNEFYSSNVTAEDTKTLSTIYAENPAYQVLKSTHSGSQQLNNKLHVYIGDITDLAVDAIVCATQTDLRREPVGMCRRVWSVGGEELRQACVSIGHCEAGQAFLTNGHDLAAKFVVHTAGPPPDSPLSYGERTQCLRQSYRSCLAIVQETPSIRSVAFPCLGSGGADIELSTAICIGLEVLREWLTSDSSCKVDHVILCMYDEYQRSNFLPLLIRTFPFPKAGPPAACSESARVPRTDGGGEEPRATNVLCYKYDRAGNVRDTVAEHFPQLVDTLTDTLSCPRVPPTTLGGEVVEIELKTLCHRLKLCHSEKTGTLEFQIINTAVNADCVETVTCSEVQAVVEDFLETHLDNVTSFRLQVRCELSEMGERRGLWSIDSLQSQNDVKTCSHPVKRIKHTVDASNLLKYWRFSRLITSDRKKTDNRTRPDYLPSQQPLPEAPWVVPGHAGETETETGVYPPPGLNNLATGGREPDEDSWVHSTEGSFISVSTVESESDSGTPVKVLKDDGNESATKERLNIQNFLRLGMNKIKRLVSPPSSETESECKRVNAGGNGNTKEYDRVACEGSTAAAGLNDLHGSPTTNSSSSKDPSQMGASSSVAEPKSLTTCQSVGSILPSNICDSNWGGEENDEGETSSTQNSQDMSSMPRQDIDDKTLLAIARQIGNKHKELGIELGLHECDVQSCQQRGEGNAHMYGWYILKKWRSQKGSQASIKELLDAMHICDIDTYRLKQKYCGDY